MADQAENKAADEPTDEFKDVKPGLSDEERAALAAEDDQAGDGSTKDDDADATDIPPRDGADADSDEAAAAGPSEIPRGMAANVELQPTRDVDFNAIGQRLNDLDLLQADLDKRYDEEEIDAKAYLQESRAITTETNDLQADVREAQFVTNANKSMAVNDWQKSVNTFVDNNQDFESPIMQGALNAALNELYADEANLGSSHNWYLQTARRAVQEQISPAQAAADNPSDADSDAVKAARSAANKAADDKGKLPKTLGDAPAADAESTSQDKFADLDGLSGIELEAKLASMTDAQADEYLQAN